MNRFILQENIKIFRRFLSEERDLHARRTVEALLAEAIRDLARMGQSSNGSMRSAPMGLNRPTSRLTSRFRESIETSPIPKMLLDPRPGFHIVDVNDLYARATLITRGRAAGSKLFDIFPDNPDLANADGVSNLHQSLRIAVETGQPHAMATQRYDVRDHLGVFVERHWQPTNTPVFDEDGRLLVIVHQAEDVTDRVLAGRRRSDK